MRAWHEGAAWGPASVNSTFVHPNLFPQGCGLQLQSSAYESEQGMGSMIPRTKGA